MQLLYIMGIIVLKSIFCICLQFQAPLQNWLPITSSPLKKERSQSLLTSVRTHRGATHWLYPSFRRLVSQISRRKWHWEVYLVKAHSSVIESLKEEGQVLLCDPATKDRGAPSRIYLGHVSLLPISDPWPPHPQHPISWPWLFLSKTTEQLPLCTSCCLSFSRSTLTSGAPSRKGGNRGRGRALPQCQQAAQPHWEQSRQLLKCNHLGYSRDPPNLLHSASP